MLDRKFPQFKIRENYKPDWLISSDNTWLELDFYIEEINIAIEVQGEQHFRFISFFHKTQDDFEKRKKHDKEKKDLCYGKGIRFIEICTLTDANILVKDIEDRYCVQPKFFYQESELINPKIYKSKSKKLLDPNSRHSKRKEDPNFEADKRLEKCKKYIELYNKGELKASSEKLLEWQKVIDNDGNI